VAVGLTGSPELAQVQQAAVAAAADVLDDVDAALVPHVQLPTAAHRNKQQVVAARALISTTHTLDVFCCNES
jgi:hypothetical protein